MAYCSASDVAALCRNLLSNEMNFGSSTSPSIYDVTRWMSSGCAVLETYLGGAGYTVPVANTSVTYGWLIELNTLYAAARAELSRTNVIVGPGERTRGQIFNQLFWDGLSKLLTIDLSSGASGLTLATTGGVLYGGGISQADKDTYNTDSDRVKPRFMRGQFTTHENAPTSACDWDY